MVDKRRNSWRRKAKFLQRGNLRHQHDLERINRTLELRIAQEIERNSEADRRIMQQARFTAMGEMIGNIAHQWRQPLNMLGILIQQMEMEHEGGSLTAEVMQARVARGMELLLSLSRTIDDFRNFFRPAQDPHPFSLARAVAKTVRFFEPSCSGHGIALRLEGNSDAMFTGHVSEFSQALLNILNNARDALMERSCCDPFIAVSVADGGGHCTVTIRDNGGGIAQDAMDRIFDPYFSTKDEGKGTGVGLYMAKTVVERQMGGSINVRNVDDGAEFTLVL